MNHQIPLLRSEEKMEKAALRLLHFCQIGAERVISTLGIEQEYFIIDRELFLLRPDLVSAGRTVFGAKPPKGQESEDSYFPPGKARVLAFMREFEEKAISLGIPVKTRQSEATPAQHEVTPFYERTSIAVEHNVLLMEIMQQTALKHDLACLFHEKPFAGINGSGKQNNWFISTETGLNLFDPKENSLFFWILLTAVLRGVHRHGALLRASVASPGNDHRLGGLETSPPIFSVYLGEALKKFIQNFINGAADPAVQAQQIDIGLAPISPFLADRNQISFFTFTGNQFEFRSVGASAHCALPLTVLHAVVAESLELLLDEIEQTPEGVDRWDRAIPLLRKHLQGALPVLFCGNEYSPQWEQEAKRRGLPNIRTSYHTYAAFLQPAAVAVLDGILTEAELQSRVEIFIEQYAKIISADIALMIELFRTQILPAALTAQKQWAEALHQTQQTGVASGPRLLDGLEALCRAIEEAIGAIDELERIEKQSAELGWDARAKVLSELAIPKIEEARRSVDLLETKVDNTLWPLPKYREFFSPWR